MQGIIKNIPNTTETRTRNNIKVGIPAGAKPEEGTTAPAGIPTTQYKNPLTRPQTDQITYNLYVEIMETVKYCCNDPEILNDISEQLQDYIYMESIPSEIIKLEELTQQEYINTLFQDIYTEEITAGLEETTITPEMYNYKILEYIKGTLEQETFIQPEHIKIIGSEAIELKNPEYCKHQIQYYIENDLFKNLTEALDQILYRLDENPDTSEDLRNWIYINSYYHEE